MTTDPTTAKAPPATESIRTGLTADTLRRAVVDNLACLQASYPAIATPHDWYMALAYSVRDRMLARWVNTAQAHAAGDVKVACYLSAEFLIGPQLGNNLVNLGIEASARAAMRSLDQDLDALLELEEEPGLGNGGLGRLAACYLDSMATLEVPAIGYGIRYEFGIFDQEIRDGWQVEVTDKWLQKGNPWEIVRPETSFYVNFGGHTVAETDPQGRYRVRWIPGSEVKGVACDTPVLGYRVNTCNTLRLWKSEAVESFEFEDFNVGDYYGAVQEKVNSETLSKVLYPNDELEVGKRLRLAQQYFFVSCSLQDMLRLLDLKGAPIARLPELFAAQLNDTHPSVAVAELMRLLVDERMLPWDEAWDITRRTLAYTNHTLLPEALETWGLPLFRSLLPRPLEIIYEINHRFLDEVRQRYPGDDARVARMSLIDETGNRRVRMANLATVGSHAVNGVAALHSTLLKQTVLRDFAELWPERFLNVTNGVTPAALRGAEQPGPLAPAGRDGGRRLGHRSWPAQGPRSSRRRRAVPGAMAPDQAIEQGGAGAAHPQPHRHRRRSGRVVRHPGQAHPRIQAAAPECAAHHHALPASASRPAARHRAALLHLRRQGRTGLPHGQAHDPPDHRRGRSGERGAGHGRTPERRVLPGLQRQERACRLSSGRPVRADLHCGQGSLGHRQHEVHAERRPDHRDAGRRQRRDPRGSGG